MSNQSFGSGVRGFTLIELLIVIMIMGVLIAVILPVFNSTRDKAVDAAVKSDLIAVREQAGIFYDTNGTYVGMCAGDYNVLQAMEAATTAVASIVTMGALGDAECVGGASEFAAWVNLARASTSAHCVDSNGASKLIPAQDSTAVDLTQCP